MLLAASIWLVGGCADQPDRSRPPADDVVKAAQQLLTDRCLTDQGLTPPRPGQRPPSPAEGRQVAEAMFGTGAAELSLTLPTGYVVRAHTDGCLATAQQALYGDQKLWFRVSTIVNNLQPEARHRGLSLAAVRDQHRGEITDRERLRAHALDRATTLLRQQQQRKNHSP